jgi:hypothetical protein
MTPEEVAMDSIRAYLEALKLLGGALAQANGRDPSKWTNSFRNVAKVGGWPSRLNIGPGGARPRRIPEGMHEDMIDHALKIAAKMDESDPLRSVIVSRAEATRALFPSYEAVYETGSSRKNHRKISLQRPISVAINGIQKAIGGGWVGAGSSDGYGSDYWLEKFIPALRAQAGLANERQVMSTLRDILFVLESRPDFFCADAYTQNAIYAHVLHIGSWRAIRWRRQEDLLLSIRHLERLLKKFPDIALKDRLHAAQEAMRCWDVSRVTPSQLSFEKLIRYEANERSKLAGYVEPYGAYLLNAATEAFNLALIHGSPINSRNSKIGNRRPRELFLRALDEDREGKHVDMEGYGMVAAHYCVFLAASGDVDAALGFSHSTLELMVEHGYLSPQRTLSETISKIKHLQAAKSRREWRAILLTRSRVFAENNVAR